jgi:hypothetical protein
MEGHPHFDVVETQSSPIAEVAHESKPKPVIDNEASPYDKPESVYDKPWTPNQSGTDHADSMKKPATQEEPGSSRDKSETFDKPGTAHDGKDSDTSSAPYDHKPKSPAETDDAPSRPSKSTSSKASAKGGRTLVVYAYAESDSARENLKYFIKKGLNGAADFVFMFNGETDADQLIPDKPNVRVVRRPNTCYDLGAMGEVLRKDDLWKGYSRFITMNASIRGPFLPVWSKDCWMDRYLDRITDEVKVCSLLVSFTSASCLC